VLGFFDAGDTNMAEHYLCVRMWGSRQTLRKFLSVYRTEVENVIDEGDRRAIDVLVPTTRLEFLARQVATHEVLFDATARGLERLKPIDRDGRPAVRSVPRGLGIRR
jgi:hypothetical protein